MQHLVDLNEKELARLFINTVEDGEAEITFVEFTKLVRRSVFFRSILSNYEATHKAVRYLSPAYRR